MKARERESISINQFWLGIHLACRLERIIWTRVHLYWSTKPTSNSSITKQDSRGSAGSVGRHQSKHTYNNMTYNVNLMIWRTVNFSIYKFVVRNDASNCYVSKSSEQWQYPAWTRGRYKSCSFHEMISMGNPGVNAWLLWAQCQVVASLLMLAPEM